MISPQAPSSSTTPVGNVAPLPSPMLGDIPPSSQMSLSLPSVLTDRDIHRRQPAVTSSTPAATPSFSHLVPIPARSTSSMPSILHSGPFSTSSPSLTSSSLGFSQGLEPHHPIPNSAGNNSTGTYSVPASAQDNDALTMLPLQDPAPKKRKREDMSSSTPPNLDFVDPTPQHLHCPICQSVYNKPVIVNGCGHEFCDECLRRALSTSSNCPMCRQAINTSKPFSTPLRRVQEEVDRLRVRCPFSGGGCDVIVSYGSLDNHVDSCPFAVVECHHELHGCEWEGTRQGLSQHLAECQFEKMKGFTYKTATEIAELKSRTSMLESEVKRLKMMESVLKTRGDRMREQYKQKMGCGQPGVEGQITVVRVAERGTIQWMFKVKTNTKLGKVQEILQLKRGKPVLLTCDGPLQLGGTVIDKNESLFDLGLASSSIATHNGTLIFAEIL